MKKYVILQASPSDNTISIKTDYLHHRKEGYEKYGKLDTYLLVITPEELYEIYNYVSTIDDINDELEIEGSH